jgi:hypothetical protein
MVIHSAARSAAPQAKAGTTVAGRIELKMKNIKLMKPSILTNDREMRSPPSNAPIYKGVTDSRIGQA